MASGTVKWFNPTKGYGFIEPSDGGKDVFVHISAVERAGMTSLNEGQKISYEVVPGHMKSCPARMARARPRISPPRTEDYVDDARIKSGRFHDGSN
jgi:CspA family cold shock protein